MVGGHRVGHEQHGHYWDERKRYGKERLEKVLALLFEGKGPDEIAAAVGLRQDTVETILRDSGYWRGRE